MFPLHWNRQSVFEVDHHESFQMYNHHCTAIQWSIVASLGSHIFWMCCIIEMAGVTGWHISWYELVVGSRCCILMWWCCHRHTVLHHMVLSPASNIGFCHDWQSLQIELLENLALCWMHNLVRLAQGLLVFHQHLCHFYWCFHRLKFLRRKDILRFKNDTTDFELSVSQY